MILEELNNILSSLDISIESGIFKGNTKDTFIVLVPLTDSFLLHSDDTPQIDYQEVRISIFTKENYVVLINKIIKILIDNYFYITKRIYNGYETDTGYYQYTIDVAKNYEFMEE